MVGESLFLPELLDFEPCSVRVLVTRPCPSGVGTRAIAAPDPESTGMAAAAAFGFGKRDISVPQASGTGSTNRVKQLQIPGWLLDYEALTRGQVISNMAC